jgi:hypothetical protein
MKNNVYDAGMEFEKLAKAVFDNCQKGDDPWGYTMQEKYNLFVPIPTLEGRRALSIIFVVAI